MPYFQRLFPTEITANSKSVPLFLPLFSTSFFLPLKTSDFFSLGKVFVKKLQNSLNTMDVTFKFPNNQEVKAHKIVLIHRSEVWEKMFESGLTESKTGVIEVKDVPFETWQSFIKMVYFEYPSMQSVMRVEGIYAQYKLAHEYNIETIMNYLEERLCPLIRIEHIVSLLDMMKIYGMAKVKRFIESTFDFKSNTFDDLYSNYKLSLEYDQPEVSKRLDQEMATKFNQTDDKNKFSWIKIHTVILEAFEKHLPLFIAIVLKFLNTTNININSYSGDNWIGIMVCSHFLKSTKRCEIRKYAFFYFRGLNKKITTIPHYNLVPQSLKDEIMDAMSMPCCNYSYSDCCHRNGRIAEKIRE